MTTSLETLERLKVHVGLAAFGTIAVPITADELRSLLADADRCETLERESERLKAQADKYRRTLNNLGSWLASFSMPPTSTIQEKEDALAEIESALAPAPPAPEDRP